VGDYGHVLINGKNVSQNKIDYHMVVLNPETGQIEVSEDFNTYQIKADSKRMNDFINSVARGRIVCIAVAHETSLELSQEEGNVFEHIGAKENISGHFLRDQALIGVKGAKKGEALEQISDEPVEVYVPRGAARREGNDDPRAVRGSHFKSLHLQHEAEI
jgi:hypothetical protein